MKYLADVNVLSEPTKGQAEAKVLQWLLAHHADIVVDPIVLGEMWEGIVALPDGRRKQNLMTWFHQTPSSLVCLDWTRRTAVVWAELRDEVRRRGFTVPLKDTMIAATAKLHGLIVATRNVDDFIRCGVHVVNPFV
ncbi:MAG: PIN domain-containing protein [Verrucomicrobiaceae bacterium]|nr:PIN domain-containing protein [Verrucomicrobiaceae bacterium]